MVPPRTHRAHLGQTQGPPGNPHQEFNIHTQSPNQDIWPGAPSLYPLFSLAGQEQERKLPLARNLGVSKSVSVGNQNGKLKSQKAKENSLQTADYSWTVNVDSENIRKKNLYLASGSVT